MLIEGLYAEQLQTAAIETLKAARTLAGDSVFEAKDWPTDPSLFPMLLVHIPRERKQGVGPGVPQFNTTFTLAVIGRAVANGAGSRSLEDVVRQLTTQIENALLCTPDFVAPIQRFVSIEVTTAVTTDGGQPIAEVGFVAEIEIWQVYAPDTGEPLRGVEMDLINADGGQTLAVTKVNLTPP